MPIKRIYFVYVSLILSLLTCFSCKSDKSIVPDSEKTLEEIYFEDYESPENLWTFIDKDGNELFKPSYDNLRDFNLGLAIANRKGKWGVIDKDNNEVVPFKYKELRSSFSDVFIAKDFENSYVLIDHNEKILYSNPDIESIYSLDSSNYRFKKYGLWGIMNDKFETVIEPGYTSIHESRNDLYLVSLNEEDILIDKSGDELYRGSSLKWLDNNHLLNQQEHKFEILKVKNGEVEVFFKDYGDAQYNETSEILLFERGKYRFYNWETGIFTTTYRKVVDPLGEGLWSIYDQKYLGTIDQDKELIHNPKYNIIYPFVEGRAAVGRDDLWGFIDAHGKEIIRRKYYLVWNFNNGIARVFTEQGIAFIDKSGSIVIPANRRYLEVKDFKEGYARVQKR